MYSLLTQLELSFVFLQQFFELYFYLFVKWVFEFLKVRPMGLWKFCHGSRRSPSLLYEESVMALGVRHGYVTNPSLLCEQSVMALQGICHLWRLTSASTNNIPPWWTPRRVMTNSSQSHDGLLVETWRIFQRPRVFFFSFKNIVHLKKKQYLKLCQ